MFLDAGTGVGNVLVQVVLQTRASRVVGFEIPGSLAATTMKLSAAAVSRLSLLLEINVITAGIRPITQSNDIDISAGSTSSPPRPGSLISSATV